MEKEFEVKYKNGFLELPADAKKYINSLGIKNLRIKILSDIEEICNRENISFKLVSKLSKTQGIPFEIALGLLLAQGKVKKINYEQKKKANFS